jgi:2-dehydro-3-deoxygluconokinase
VKVAIIGECMLELSNASSNQIIKGMMCRFNYGGDSLNTAIYMSRMGVDVSYISALGDDVYSKWLLQEWESEGIDTSLVATIEKSSPGLYMIQTDDQGERSFSYWRDNSAARQYFNNHDNIAGLLASLTNFDMVYLSGISLSLMSDDYFKELLNGLATLRASGLKVAFDINYRLRGWSSPNQAMKRISALLDVCDIALPTHDDEVLLFGDNCVETTIQRYQQSGVVELVIKLGAEGAMTVHGNEKTPVAGERVAKVLDSTGAGDSFNAGYLAARLKGQSCENSAKAGNLLASTVIQYRGAIIDNDQMPAGL